MENNKLLQRLYAYKKNPDFIKPLENNELAELVLVLLSHVQNVEKAVEKGILKGDKGEDGYTPVKDKDYLSTATAKKRIEELFAKAEQRIKNGADGKDGKDGKDAEVTLENLKEAARMAREMIELPDFDELITQEPTAIRDALELLQDGERLSMDAIEGLNEALDKVQQKSGGNFGATIARRLATIGDVSIEGVTDGQALVYNATSKQWEAGDVSSTIDELNDIGDVSATSPTSNDVLTWNGSAWVPAEPPGASGGEANTASNVGTAGVGIFKQKTSVDLEFKKLNAGSTKVTVTDDTGNNEVDIDVDPSNINTSDLNNDANWSDDQTGAEIKTAYEAEADTNAFTDAEKTKLAGIETSADVTDAGNVGTAMTGATAKTTPVDADTMPLNDSAASNVLKKVTWANIKATLKTYFDTLYAAVSHTHTESEITDLGSYIESTGVTYENLDANGDVGTGAGQVAIGNHTHAGVYEPADATILKEADVDDTPVNGATAAPVSSNWAYDHENAADPHPDYYKSGDAVDVTEIDYDIADGAVSALGNLGATEAVDWSTATHFTGTLDSNVTMTHSNEVSGRKITLYLAYDGSAQRTITWSDVDKWLDNSDGSAPAAPSASGEVLVVTMQYVGTTCYASATGNYAVYA